jgi:hypothetical protein
MWLAPLCCSFPLEASSDNDLDTSWGTLPLGLNAFSDSCYASMERFDLKEASSFNQHIQYEQNTNDVPNSADSGVQKGGSAFQLTSWCVSVGQFSSTDGGETRAGIKMAIVRTESVVCCQARKPKALRHETWSPTMLRPLAQSLSEAAQNDHSKLALNSPFNSTQQIITRPLRAHSRRSDRHNAVRK